MLLVIMHLYFFHYFRKSLLNQNHVLKSSQSLKVISVLNYCLSFIFLNLNCHLNSRSNQIRVNCCFHLKFHCYHYDLFFKFLIMGCLYFIIYFLLFTVATLVSGFVYQQLFHLSINLLDQQIFYQSLADLNIKFTSLDLQVSSKASMKTILDYYQYLEYNQIHESINNSN